MREIRRGAAGLRNWARLVPLAALLVAGVASADAGRQLYWGDTHLHSAYSFDAFLNGNLSADPDTAYRWAKGLPVVHPYHRARVQVETPLSFEHECSHRAELLRDGRDIEHGFRRRVNANAEIHATHRVPTVPSRPG